MQIPKEIQELRASVESLKKEYQELKAMPADESHQDKMRNMEDMMFRMIGYVHERISYLENGFYEYTYAHSKGHIPSIMGAEKMEKALQTLGLDKDYQVWKPTIAAANNKYGLEVLE